MVEGVILGIVAGLDYARRKFGVGRDACAEHEERRYGVVPREHLQHLGGPGGVGAVVEGEVDDGLAGAPVGGWE